MQLVTPQHYIYINVIDFYEFHIYSNTIFCLFKTLFDCDYNLNWKIFWVRKKIFSQNSHKNFYI